MPHPIPQLTIPTCKKKPLLRLYHHRVSFKKCYPPVQPFRLACRRPEAHQSLHHKHPWHLPPIQRTRRCGEESVVLTLTCERGDDFFLKVPQPHLLYHSMHILLDIKGNCTISNLSQSPYYLSFNKVGKFYPLARGPLSQCLPQPVNVAKRPRYGNRPVS